MIGVEFFAIGMFLFNEILQEPVPHSEYLTQIYGASFVRICSMM